jgi:starch synthase
MSRKQKTKLKILMPAAEIAPLAKAGGLADVVGSLPVALKKLGCDVRLIMPLYEFIDKKKYKLKRICSNIEIPSGHKIKIINLWQANLPGTRILIYFIEAPGYFTSQSVYKKGGNSERFLFFSLACLYITPIIKFKPDIVHCHDVHTALIPDILKNTNYLFLKGIKTLFTIHNFKYQGQTEIEVLSTGNLTKDSLESLSRDAQDGDINFMVQGVLNADIINTVSQTYAQEITTPAHGHGLDNIIRKRKKDLFGVLNGIDTKFFNPATDKNIKQRYTIRTLSKKKINKLNLQKRLGLPQNKDIAVVGFISRLVWQKGLELISEKLCQLNCQFVCLGTGWEKYEKHLKNLAQRYPDKFSAQIMFDLKLAQQIYAGADMFLIPSRFEPCGLGQMIAMRYGTVPVVRAIGGLADTVDARVGFKFKEFFSQALYQTLQKALKVYYQQPKKWQQLQINGMKRNFSWDKSAKEYLKLYKKLINKVDKR